MPKRVSYLRWVKANLALVGFVLSMLAAGVSAVRAYDALLDTNQRLRERIRVLERIEVSEHPDYSAMIDWSN